MTEATKTKKIASSLASAVDHPLMKTIRNRQSDIFQVIDEVKKWWTFDLYSRKPGPAHDEDGYFIGTDLDLACFLSALIDRKAVINLPTYKARRATTKKANEWVVSKDNRHGHVNGLTANDNVFSFSIRVHDMNVVTKNDDGSETIGAPRNFMLVDLNGEWHKGWRCIEFMPSARENDFLNDKNLWTENKIYFKHFVSPNRWVSLYGQYYFITKALIDRLEEQAAFYFREAKRLREKYDYKKEASGWEKPESAGKSKSIEVDAFEAQVYFGGYESEFNGFPEGGDAENAKAFVNLIESNRKQIVYTILPQLRFAVRTVELSFYKHGLKGDGKVERFPAWIKNAEWQDDYVEKGKRTKWNRLVLAQKGVGELGISIMYRIWRKSERVAAED